MKHLGYLLLGLLASCSVKTSVESTPTIDEAKTREVLQHHLDAFANHDLEAIMADYIEESILITPDQTFTGLDQIRKNYEGAFTIFQKDSSTFNLHTSVVSKDVAYVLWDSKTPKFTFSFGTDTFVVQNGKIVRQTFAGVITPN